MATYTNKAIQANTSGAFSTLATGDTLEFNITEFNLRNASSQAWLAATASAISIGNATNNPTVAFLGTGVITFATTSITASALTTLSAASAVATMSTLALGGAAISGFNLAVGGTANITSDVTIGGNLTVNGTTITVSSTSLTIADNLIGLQNGPSGTGKDAGILMERYGRDVAGGTSQANGTAAAGSATTIGLTGGSATDSFYVGWIVKASLTSSPTNATTRYGRITAYVGATKVATVTNVYDGNDVTTGKTLSAVDTTYTWNVYKKTFMGLVWDEVDQTFALFDSVNDSTTSTAITMDNYQALKVGALTTTGAATIAGATTVSTGGLSVTGGIDNNSGGLTEAGAISGATTIAMAGALSGATTIGGSGLATLGSISAGAAGFTVSGAGAVVSASINNSNGGITNAGAISGATTIAMGGALSGATTIDGSGDLTVGTITMVGFSVDADGDTVTKSLNNTSGGITLAGAISGATTLAMTGALSGLTTLSMSGAFSGATTMSNSGACTFDTGANGSSFAGALTIGGGYGSTGVTISTAGVIQANGTLTVDGVATLTTGFDSNAASTVTTLTVDGADLSRYIDLVANTSASPAAPSDGTGRLYSKTVATFEEMFFRSDGGEVQITSGGGLNLDELTGLTGTTSDSFTVNSDLTNSNVDLVLGRTTGGNATLRWNGTTGSFDKAMSFSSTLAVVGLLSPAAGLTVTGGNTSVSGGTITLTSTGAASLTSTAGLTLTGATASTWSTSAEALTLSGFTGIILQKGGTTLMDVGLTADTVTLAAGKHFAAASGASAISFGSATGAVALPTGNLSWAGAVAGASTMSLVATGTGTVSSGGVLTLSTSNGATANLPSNNMAITTGNGSGTGASGDITLTTGTSTSAPGDVVFKPANAVVSENIVVADGAVTKGDVLYMSATGFKKPADNTVTHIAGIAAADAANAAAVKLAGMPGSTVSALTTGMTKGNVVYLSSAGILTATLPVSGNVIRIGVVTVVGAVGTGRILYQPQFMYTIA